MKIPIRRLFTHLIDAVIGAVLAICLVLLLQPLIPELAAKLSPSIPSGPPTLERLSDLSELLTLRIDVADVVVERIEGWTGGAQAVLLVRGDVCLGVDLAAACFENVDPEARTATLVLPQPQASMPRVDHDRARVVALSKEGLWLISPDDEPYAVVVERALGAAQHRILIASNEPAIHDRARLHAEASTR